MNTNQNRRDSYVSGASANPLLGQTIGENLRATVEQYPDNEALVCTEQGYRATYRSFWEQVTEVAKAFVAAGVKQGDRVGIWAPNRFEWVLVQYATARIGAILVNINPAYRATELAFVLQKAEVSLLISALHFKTSDYASLIAQIWHQCPSLREVIYLDKDWDSFCKSGSPISDNEIDTIEEGLQFDDPINIQYTSGTTGFPKGVTLSHHNILNNGYFIGKRLKYTAADRVCIPVPFYHCFGMVIGNLCCTSHGATMIIPAASFSPASTLKTVQDERCTSLYGVPTMFITELNLVDFDSYDLSSLRTGIMAGSPCPTEIMKQVKTKMHMNEVGVCYGMTETSPVSTQTEVGVALVKQVSTVGTVHDHLEIKIIDTQTGKIVKRGVKGEVCTRGYSVMLGYWNDPIATETVLDKNGWLHTGDEGSMDEEGFISITGRIKDVIIRGGENISPKEIEEFLYGLEEIEDVQVIGVPSEKYGEEIMAWVKLRNGHQANEQQLRDKCIDQIAHYKIPKYWKFVDSFPTTITGKIRKKEMREISTTELFNIVNVDER
ncbi:AMP-binding protein [Olivibacter sitiensis]|uniref:AMP-binding protein n=1 Tax=Olivibacter sitiensis TaxID=376470 RepID=UPI0004192FA5|nr:AMP-binding protein [Olivibacter sitiensis]